MALSARVPRTPLSRLVAILAVILVADLLISAAVYVDRLDDPDIPAFNRAGVAGVRWDVDPYRDPSSLLGFPDGPRPPAGATTPEARALYAIAALERYDRTRERRWVGRARRALRPVREAARNGFVAHRQSTTDLLGRPVEPPWYSAAMQGMLLSALGRLEAATGNRRLMAEADQAFTALRSFQGFFAGSSPAPQNWLASVDGRGYLWFDEFSTGLSSTQVLTQQLWTATGIYDYHRLIADRPTERRLARQMFAGSVATVRHYLPDWRVPGQISASSLVARNRDVRSHFVAGAQLKMLADITGEPWARRAAQLFDQDDNLPYFPVKPVAALPSQDAYDPLPPEIAELARAGRPERQVWPRARTAGTADDPLRQCAQALTLLADSASPRDVERAARLIEQVLATASNGAIPHRARLEDIAGEPVTRPWYSAATQGMLLSALTRLSERTDDPRWRRAADPVYGALSRVRDYGEPTQQPWFGLIDYSGNLYFDQELGASVPPRSIYEHVIALLGLYDYWRLTQDDGAFAHFAGGVTTLRDVLPLVRRRGAPIIESLASGVGDRGYHAAITAGIEGLAEVTKDKRLTRFARLLREDYP